jgi:hypothetical protein
MGKKGNKSRKTILAGKVIPQALTSFPPVVSWLVLQGFTL